MIAKRTASSGPASRPQDGAGARDSSAGVLGWNPSRNGPRPAPPIFVVGVPRSGTTLLAAMLGAHPRLWCGPETHFYHYLPADARPLCRRADWPEAAVDYLDSIMHIDHSILQNYGLTRPEMVEAMARKEPCVASILSALMEVALHRAGKSRWVEKTPEHLPNVERIRGHFPDARIIRIVRDPRDVLSSLLAVSWSHAPRSYLAGVHFWMQFDNPAARLLGSDSKSYTLRYEDLVLNPEPTLRELCRFIDEPFDPAMLNTAASVRSVNATNEPWKTKVAEPVDASRAQAWRQKLSDGERRLVEAFLGDRLRDHGYESGDSELPRYFDVHPRGILESYPEIVDTLVAAGVRFWGARGERPERVIFVGNPYRDNWISGSRRERMVKAARIVAIAARCRSGGVPVAWLQPPDTAGDRGRWSDILAHVLPEPMPIGRITEFGRRTACGSPS